VLLLEMEQQILAVAVEMLVTLQVMEHPVTVVLA
jgi:hypothetical protein